MRAFLAIPIPEEIKDYAHKIKSDLDAVRPDIKWVEHVNYHLTIKFLGDVSNKDINIIRENMRTVGESCPSFQLNIGGIGFFPNKIRPRVVWLGMNGELDKANFLAARVDAYLSSLGFEPEKNHRFHLTLGRIRSERNINEMMRKVMQVKNNKLSFTVDRFHLMESKLSSSGPVYTIIDKFPING